MSFDFLSFYKKAETIYTQDSPFIYSFCDEVLEDYHNITLPRTQSYRTQLLANTNNIQLTNIGSGSMINSRLDIKVSDLAKSSSSHFEKCQLLISIAKWSNASNVLELGTNLGLAALAFGESGMTVDTIEGNSDLFQLAHSSLCSFENIRCYHSKFLEFLYKNKQSYDLIFIDGDHSYHATKRLINEATKCLRTNGIIIIDDIRWSSEMKMIWKELISADQFNTSIDLFAIGLVLEHTALKSTIIKSLIPKRYKPWPYHFFRK
tara:strand:- start:1043 stop:1831 length:789 start_codon:yes stop_codon:yes gene_type:complete